MLDAELRTLVLSEFPEIHAVEHDRAGRGFVEPGEETEEGRLPATRRADNGHEPARLDG